MKLLLRYLFVPLLACFVLATSARGQLGNRLVKPSVAADTTAITPGKPFTVGVIMKIEPGWHIYWQYAGAAGNPPEIRWTLPAGFRAGPIQWPVPDAHTDSLGTGFIYDQEVMFPVEITPPADLPPGEITLDAKLVWFICSNVCTRGTGAVQLKLPAGGTAEPANQELFTKWRAQLPKAAGAVTAVFDDSNPKEIKATVEGLAPDAKVEFFPIPPEGATPGAPTVSPADGSGKRIITVPLTTPAAAGGTWKGLVVAQKSDGTREAWYIPSEKATPAPSRGPPPPVVPSARAEPPSPPSSPTSPGSYYTADTPPSPPSPPSASSVSTPTVVASPTVSRSLIAVIGLAFLGGLVLNVMPCVLPVIALKIFGFVKQAGQDPRRVFRLGLAFVAGVFVFFLGLATLAVALHASGRSFNWGAQFQNPFLLAGLIALIFVFGLNLLGVFEITLSGGATSKLSELSSREGYGGAFLHGMFTTLLGTSCTAPFLAVAVGYAMSQSAAVIYLLFATVALGMSLPYFLLTAFPKWMKYLPKPGVWMERVKQIAGFIMLAVVVWLFSVMSGSRPIAATHLSWYLLALGMACWALGSIRHSLLRWLVVAVAVVGGYFGILHQPLSAPIAGNGSQIGRRIAEARRQGGPVFVDFTADWCANCKTFEKFVIDTEPVQKAFKEKNVVTVVADWTLPDAEIEQWLNQFGRIGVPLYLLYRPGEEQPVAFDGLTKESLLGELSKVGEKSSSTSTKVAKSGN